MIFSFIFMAFCVLWSLESNSVVSTNDELINYFNFLDTSWKTTDEFRLKRIKRKEMDDSIISESGELPIVNDTMENLPEEFDSRSNWPFCPSIGEISDQASCASCWAVSAVDAMSDRLCIHSKGKYKFRLSAANLINCCTQCGNGCSGGFYKPAWEYWTKHGLVSGGAYQGEGCLPYEFKPCEHLLINDITPSCIKDRPTPPCKRECQSNYSVSYNDDLYFGKTAYTVAADEEAIKTEIYRNGPIQGSVKLFSDLYLYKSGVYKHVKGRFIFHHAVRIIGWGIDNATKVPYWLVANSFNRGWGENGFFRIERGNNECGIEDAVVAGMPRVPEI